MRTWSLWWKTSSRCEDRGSGRGAPGLEKGREGGDSDVMSQKLMTEMKLISGGQNLMKGKFRAIWQVSLALVLVLSFSLVTAVPAAAADPATLHVVPFTLEASEGATAEWTTANKYTGSSSVFLSVPSSGAYAEVSFGVNIALKDINLATTSFWCESTEGDYIPYFMFEILGNFGTEGVRLRINNDAADSAGYADWAKFVASTTTPEWQWQILKADWSVGSEGWDTWDSLVETYGTEIVTTILVENSAVTGSYPVSAYVDDITVSGTTYDLEGTADDYSSIQAAINAASPGDTINVAAGTYTEAASINPGADLTLQGAGRDVTTWIAPADDVSRMYCITSALNGYTGTTTIDVSGFTFSVEDNVISDSGMAILINRAYDGPLYLDIHDNKFIETTTIADETANSMLLCHNRYAARVDGEAPVKIYNNLDYTNGGITMSNSQAFDIYNNTFDGGSSALYIGYGCPENTTVGNHHIYNNTFKNASSAYPDPPWPSVYFAYYGSGTGMTFLPSTIESNTFEDNDVAIGYSMESDITYPADIIRFNNFDNNTEAVRVFGTYATSVNAENNWWGDASGPYHPTLNPDGSGDQVSDNVDFEPWIGAEVEEADSDTGVDASAQTTNASASATGGDETTTVAVAEYADEPTSVDPGFAADGTIFVDVQVSGTPPTQLVVEIVCPGGDCSGMVMRWFDGAAWQDVAPQVVTNGTIQATLNDVDSTPLISQLTGTAVAVGRAPQPVGGTAYPPNKLAILAPWLALFAAIIAGAAMGTRRRRAQS